MIYDRRIERVFRFTVVRCKPIDVSVRGLSKIPARTPGDYTGRNRIVDKITIKTFCRRNYQSRISRFARATSSPENRSYRLITGQRSVSLKINKFRTRPPNELAKKGGHKALREI